MPRKKASKKSKSASAAPTAKPVNKSAFVRGLPEGLSAADVIAKAKAAGITVSKAQVYTIRTNARAQAKRGGTRRPGRPPAAQAAPAAMAMPAAAKPTRVAKAVPAPKASNSLETQFVNLALDVGLSKAEGLLKRLRQAVQESLRG
jgi:hypothetical protein